MSATSKSVDLLSVTLHYAPVRDSFGEALCGIGAPAGGWFGEGNRGLTVRAEAAGAPVCPECQKAYEALPAGGSSSS